MTHTCADGYVARSGEECICMTPLDTIVPAFQQPQQCALSLDSQIELAVIELATSMRETNEAYLRLHHLRFRKRLKEIQE